MGKRGPTAKGEFGDKSAVLSTRISSDLRAALEQAVKESGLTLSREVELRLRRSFIEDDKIDVGFGNRRTYALMRVIALAMEIRHRFDVEAPLLDDPWSYDQAVKSINAVLEAYRPVGPIVQPENPYGEKGAEFVKKHPEWTSPQILENMNVQRTTAILDGIHKADPSLPLTGPKANRKRSLLKADLGELTQRAWDRNGIADKNVAKPKRKPKL